MRKWFAGLVTLLLATFLPTSTASAGSVAWPQREFIVYLAPPEKGGNDANDGLSFGAPVTSIARVHDILYTWRPNTDVEVRIQPGRYVAKPFTAWRYYVQGKNISFMPYDYLPGEGRSGIRARPVFQNARCGKSRCQGAWLHARLPTERTDPMYQGGTSGLRFYYLTIEGFSGAAISIAGDSERDVEDTTVKPALRTRGSAGLNGNVFAGLDIRRIGNRWSGGHYGWGGIVLTNSSGNRIVHNDFTNIENKGKYGGYIHGLYITHFSSKNLVRDNRFSWVSGDPIKVRNQSNDNLITRNVFRRTGLMSYYRGEFCDKRCAREHRIAQQCPSYGNRFLQNSLLGGYLGGVRLPVWSAGSGSYPYSPMSACKPLKRSKLQAAGNRQG